MKRILFVDDERHILDGLRDLLRKYRREWDMEFALGGQAAISALAERTFDAVITDMRMPVMDGASLLAQVAGLYPDMVRILLTGQADLNAAISAVNDGHIFRFLVKPCPSEVLRAQLKAALRQHEHECDESDLPITAANGLEMHGPLG